MEIEKVSFTDELVDTVNYRGVSLPVYMDENGQSYYTVINGKEVGFGTYNCDYLTEIKDVIDTALDEVYLFDRFPGAKLKYFDNAGYRDLQLTYRLRIIKVFLLTRDLTDVDLKKIKSDSEKILEKIVKK